GWRTNYDSGQPHSSLLVPHSTEYGPGQLEKSLMEVELARLQTHHFPSGHALPQDDPFGIVVQVEDAMLAVVEDDIHLVLDKPLPQRQWRVQGHEPPATEDRHAITDLFHFQHVVRRQQYGHA